VDVELEMPELLAVFVLLVEDDAQIQVAIVAESPQCFHREGDEPCA